MQNSYAGNETYLTVFLNANNKDDLAPYHWTIDVEIIGSSEIIAKY